MLRMAFVKTRAALLRLPFSVVRSISVVERLGRPVAYRRGTSDEEVLEHSFDKDIFFRGVPEYQPNDGDVILDVGAHMGDFSLLGARKVGGGRVYAIEPCHETYKLLQLNIRLGQARNIHPFRIALSDNNGECQLYYAPNREDWGNSTVYNYSFRKETVKCLTLETFLTQHGIDKVDFAKFNCEGGEFPVILNSDATILRRFRIMLILYHCDLAPGFDEGSLARHLESCGFAVKFRERTAQRGWIIAIRQEYAEDGSA
jgi:FkbM family methyltransferase